MALGIHIGRTHQQRHQGQQVSSASTSCPCFKIESPQRERASLGHGPTSWPELGKLPRSQTKGRQAIQQKEITVLLPEVAEEPRNTTTPACYTLAYWFRTGISKLLWPICANKVLLDYNHASLVTCVICGCFRDKTKWGSCNRGRMAHRA